MELKFVYFIKGLLICLSCCVLHVDGYYNYHFMEEECNPNGSHIDLTKETSTYGNVEVVRDGGYSPNLRCKLTIWAPPGYRLTVRFKQIEIYKPEEDCTTDYLMMRGNTTYVRYCGTGRPSYSMTTTGRFLELEFVSGDHDFDNDRMGFWLYYTAYHTGVCNEENGQEWECHDNFRCIPGELLCDDFDNCGNWADERSGTCGLPTATIVMISIMSVLCVGVCIAAGVYFVIDKKKGRHRRSRRRGQPQNNVVPSVVGYNTGVDPNAPPPYSTYFTTPAYTEQKELPPAYSNLGYDTVDSVTTDTTADTTNTNTATAPAGEENETYQTINTPSTSRSTVITPPTGSRKNSQSSTTPSPSAEGAVEENK